MPFSFLYCSLWQPFGNVNRMLYLFFLKQEMLTAQPEVTQCCTVLENQAVSSWLLCHLISAECWTPPSLHPARKNIEQHFVCPCRVLLVPTAHVGVRVGAKRTSLGKGERKSYCLSKYFCECGVDWNFETEGVFIQQILAGFVSYLWKTCTLDEFFSSEVKQV